MVSQQYRQNEFIFSFLRIAPAMKSATVKAVTKAVLIGLNEISMTFSLRFFNLLYILWFSNQYIQERSVNTLSYWATPLGDTAAMYKTFTYWAVRKENLFLQYLSLNSETWAEINTFKWMSSFSSLQYSANNIWVRGCTLWGGIPKYFDAFNELLNKFKTLKKLKSCK